MISRGDRREDIYLDDEDRVAWLDRDGLLGQFGKKRKSGIGAYRRFVMEGKGLPSPLDQTRHQSMLGDDGFVARHRQDKTPAALRDVTKAQRRSIALSLDDYRERYRNRHEAVARAYLSGAYTMSEIGVHYMTMSRAVRRFELNNRECCWNERTLRMDPGWYKRHICL
ncbi:MAG: hypothetical protein JXR29_12940 [Methylothermaceae bacterium]|nr:hypothetical protein [Methylothermaceae bacterium]